MKFPRDHFPHDAAVEWWYVWLRWDDVMAHHCQFKNTIGHNQRIVTHASLDGKFIELTEWEVESGRHLLRLSGSSLTGSNDLFRFHLNLCGDPVIHNEEIGKAYYSIPSVEGKITIDGVDYDCIGWFDHEWFNIPTNFKELRYRRKWEWTSLIYRDGRWGMEYSHDPPTAESPVFHPKYGPAYSEIPIEIIVDGKQIAFGVKEKVYG
jgi:predicted secreted hydrolase